MLKSQLLETKITKTSSTYKKPIGGEKIEGKKNHCTISVRIVGEIMNTPKNLRAKRQAQVYYPRIDFCRKC